MADHSADNQAAASSSASSSRPLRERLQSLQQVPFGSDPVERAQKVIAKTFPDQPLRLFGYVKVAATKSSDNGKGKGKEKERAADEREDAAGRLLWAFTLQRSGEPTEVDSAANQALAGLDFPDLNCRCIFDKIRIAVLTWHRPITLVQASAKATSVIVICTQRYIQTQQQRQQVHRRHRH